MSTVQLEVIGVVKIAGQGCILRSVPLKFTASTLAEDMKPHDKRLIHEVITGPITVLTICELKFQQPALLHGITSSRPNTKPPYLRCIWDMQCGITVDNALLVMQLDAPE